MKKGFLRFGNWAKSTELALSLAFKLAIDLKIPLILWGENPGLQRGDMRHLVKQGLMVIIQKHEYARRRRLFMDIKRGI